MHHSGQVLANAAAQDELLVLTLVLSFIQFYWKQSGWTHQSFQFLEVHVSNEELLKATAPYLVDVRVRCEGVFLIPSLPQEFIVNSGVFRICKCPSQ